MCGRSSNLLRKQGFQSNNTMAEGRHGVLVPVFHLIPQYIPSLQCTDLGFARASLILRDI